MVDRPSNVGQLFNADNLFMIHDSGQNQLILKTGCKQTNTISITKLSGHQHQHHFLRLHDPKDCNSPPVRLCGSDCLRSQGRFWPCPQIQSVEACLDKRFSMILAIGLIWIYDDLWLRWGLVLV